MNSILWTFVGVIIGQSLSFLFSMLLKFRDTQIEFIRTRQQKVEEIAVLISEYESLTRKITSEIRGRDYKIEEISSLFAPLSPNFNRLKAIVSIYFPTNEKLLTKMGENLQELQKKYIEILRTEIPRDGFDINFQNIISIDAIILLEQCISKIRK